MVTLACLLTMFAFIMIDRRGGERFLWPRCYFRTLIALHWSPQDLWPEPLGRPIVLLAVDTALDQAVVGALAQSSGTCGTAKTIDMVVMHTTAGSANLENCFNTKIYFETQLNLQNIPNCPLMMTLRQCWQKSNWVAVRVDSCRCSI